MSKSAKITTNTGQSQLNSTEKARLSETISQNQADSPNQNVQNCRFVIWVQPMYCQDSIKAWGLDRFSPKVRIQTRECEKLLGQKILTKANKITSIGPVCIFSMICIFMISPQENTNMYISLI